MSKILFFNAFLTLFVPQAQAMKKTLADSIQKPVNAERKSDAAVPRKVSHDEKRLPVTMIHALQDIRLYQEFLSMLLKGDDEARGFFSDNPHILGPFGVFNRRFRKNNHPLCHPDSNSTIFEASVLGRLCVMSRMSPNTLMRRFRTLDIKIASDDRSALFSVWCPELFVLGVIDENTQSIEKALTEHTTVIDVLRGNMALLEETPHLKKIVSLSVEEGKNTHILSRKTFDALQYLDVKGIAIDDLFDRFEERFPNLVSLTLNDCFVDNADFLLGRLKEQKSTTLKKLSLGFPMAFDASAIETPLMRRSEGFFNTCVKMLSSPLFSGITHFSCQGPVTQKGSPTERGVIGKPLITMIEHLKAMTHFSLEGGALTPEIVNSLPETLTFLKTAVCTKKTMHMVGKKYTQLNTLVLESPSEEAFEEIFVPDNFPALETLQVFALDMKRLDFLEHPLAQNVLPKLSCFLHHREFLGSHAVSTQEASPEGHPLKVSSFTVNRYKARKIIGLDVFPKKQAVQDHFFVPPLKGEGACILPQTTLISKTLHQKAKERGITMMPDDMLPRVAWKGAAQEYPSDEEE